MTILKNLFKDTNIDPNINLQPKEIPKKNIFSMNQKVRKIDIEAPKYFGESQEIMRRIVKIKAFSESQSHKTNIKIGLKL